MSHSARLRIPLSAAIALVAALLAGASPARAEAPPVLASIKPVHSLVAAVMDGVGKPGLLVRGAASPHGYSLRPSDARRLKEARLVFWIGPMLEAWLEKPLSTLATAAQSVVLSAAPGVTVLAARQGGSWEDDADEPPAKPGEAMQDAHLWLDPENARAILRVVAARLAEVDPANAGRYAANRDAADRRLVALDAGLVKRLAAVRGARFVVFHDAYQYFERRYALSVIGSITVDPERPPGARRLSQIHRKIVDLHAGCVFTEPQFEPALVTSLAAGTTAHVAALDPLGADIADGPGLYPALLERLAGSILACLGGTS